MKNKETKLIRDTWAKIEYEFSTLDWNNQAKRLLEMTTLESKDHDRFRGASIRRGISINTEAKYFAIKRLTESHQKDEVRAVDYAFTQKSCYQAYSMARHPRFESIWDNLFKTAGLLTDMKTIASWDYCDLIRDEDRRRGFKSSPVDREVTA